MLVKQATCKYVHEWLVYVHEHSDLVSTLVHAISRSCQQKPSRTEYMFNFACSSRKLIENLRTACQTMCISEGCSII
jgi:hypothetical protein